MLSYKFRNRQIKTVYLMILLAILNEGLLNEINSFGTNLSKNFKNLYKK